MNSAYFKPETPVFCMGGGESVYPIRLTVRMMRSVFYRIKRKERKLRRSFGRPA